MDAGLLAVRSPERGKARLGGRFDPAQRRTIARALVFDALALCRSCPFLEWWVVSDDPVVLETAGSHGFHALRDRGEGLNAAVQIALGEISAAGADSVTILPADLPLATPEDVLDVLDTGATSEVVVVPARRGGGTNALFLSPPDVLAPAFGSHSLPAHVAAASAARLRCAILPLVRLELDIDTPEDVDEFLTTGYDRESATGAALRGLTSEPGTGG